VEDVRTDESEGREEGVVRVMSKGKTCPSGVRCYSCLIHRRWHGKDKCGGHTSQQVKSGTNWS
jgi:hypothetical protein